MASSETIKMPLSVTGKAEIARLIRELEKVDQFFINANQRKGGESPQPPRVTHLLSGMAEANRLNLLQEADRVKMKAGLQAISTRAPSVHITFAAEPPPRVLEDIVSWLRNNIHPETLVVVGLQPSIAAGVVLRTSNKIFDMSLRNHLKKQEPFLVKLIDGAMHA